jgi:hypothetical protein
MQFVIYLVRKFINIFTGVELILSQINPVRNFNTNFMRSISFQDPKVVCSLLTT